MCRILLASLLLSLASPQAQAGLIEVSYAYSQSESKFDEDNFSQSLSHTASIAWYFLQMSALELSYTRGEGQISGRAEGDPEPLLYRTELEMYGADLVVTFAQKDWAFQPYLKGGAAWVDKKIFRKSTSVSAEQVINMTDKDDAVPSMGVGFRIKLTQTIRLKASYDRWRSGKSGDDEQWDSAVRAGASVFF